MTKQPLLTRTTDVVYQSLAGEDGAVLLHVGSGQYHTLNPVGARIWEVLETPMDEAELTRRVEAEFEADNEPVVEDVKDFLANLVQRKLVYRDPSQ